MSVTVRAYAGSPLMLSRLAAPALGAVDSRLPRLCTVNQTSELNEVVSGEVLQQATTFYILQEY